VQEPKAPAARKTKGKAEADEETPSPAGQAKEKPTTYYVVKKGDTLEKIALRNNTTIPALMELNKMKKGESLHAGRRIRIAADIEPEKEPAPKAEAVKSGKNKDRKKDKKDFLIYMVKKGETLEKIAAKKNTTIAALLKLNNMKMKDPLLAGKRLKIPAEE
jgi:N-acetylmuramoyl-L-alanine amidase